MENFVLFKGVKNVVNKDYVVYCEIGDCYYNFGNFKLVLCFYK